ncbi:hypothetical protein DRE_07286 [Drechslerella stenobrocha 248]|uniref:Uncharacterized protein n=1 Tax=Drechslerella stenobrocha 248 TaxID=1043628 RepID=W7HUW4_9PEZI|nr:hypothetical protein DRE_07286 [Drechslerella stenobrocha 248]
MSEAASPQSADRAESPPYPHPLEDDVTAEPLTFREQYIRAFSCAIRDKPNWTEKILDRALFVKWVKEAQQQGPNLSSGRKVVMWDGNEIEFVYGELVERYKAYVEKLKAEGGAAAGVEPDLDGVWRGDGLVDEDLRKELLAAVATLEDVPEDEKDWHPGSDKQVLDLVHPSLWPIVYNRSVSLIDGKPIKLPEDAIEDSFSDQFCWLPSEFEVAADGKVKIASYINNLSSPDQKTLFYPILERIFERFVPLFNHVLADLRVERYDKRRVISPDGYTESGDGVEWVLPEKRDKAWAEILGQFERGEPVTTQISHQVEPETVDGEDEEAVEAREAQIEEWQENEHFYGETDEEDEDYKKAPYQVREMGDVNPEGMWEPPTITDNIRLEGKTAKVIVKLANIILTPEKPEYGGGSWHVEAMMNERIVSTGIYYYAQENITDSHLSFRRTIKDMEELQYELPQDSNWTIVHDMSREGHSVQEIGSILTKENRAIAFPNLYQHQVQPFKLIDSTKPGYRKILAFFLCDPTSENSVLTSRVVAPQQPGARSDLEEALRHGPLGKLPEEVFRLILEQLPPPISREEAEGYRESLMEERSGYLEENEQVHGAQYSLCEH